MNVGVGVEEEMGPVVKVPVTLGTNEIEGPARLPVEEVILLERVGAKDVSVKILSLIDVESTTDVVIITSVLVIDDPSIWL